MTASPYSRCRTSPFGYTRPMSDVTRLLEAVQAGDRQAAADLLPLVYDELRTLAAARMSSESPGHTLDATALVHEPQTDLVFLERCELRFGAGMRAEFETVFALIAIPLHPRPDTAVRDLQRRRHGRMRLALQDPLHRESAAIFLGLRVRNTAHEIRNQWQGSSCRDHAQRMATAFPESSGLKRTPAP